MSIDIDAPSEDDDYIDDETTKPTIDTSDEEVNNPVDSTVNKETIDTTEEGSAENADIGSDFKAAMDSYEAFMDEYVAFMKKYNSNSSDLSLLMDYANYMSKYAEFVAEFNEWEEEDMNNAEIAYYIDVQARVNKKLLEIN